MESRRVSYLRYAVSVQASLLVGVMLLSSGGVGVDLGVGLSWPWPWRVDASVASLAVSSEVSPVELGYELARRSSGGPPEALGRFGGRGALPTNAWWLNLVLGDETAATSSAYAAPWVVDTSGRSGGARASATRVAGAADQVQVTHDVDGGLTLSTAEPFLGPRRARSFGALGVGLEWATAEGSLYVPVTRGAAFLAGVYERSTPFVGSDASLHDAVGDAVVVDGASVACDGTAFHVRDSLDFTTDADLTWAIFPTAPVDLVCTQDGGGDGWTLSFEATAPTTATLRAALVSSCAYGTSALYCLPSELGSGRSSQLAARRAFGAAAKRAAPVDATATEAGLGDEDVFWAVDGDVATVRFDFWRDGADVRYALPQHLDQGGATLEVLEEVPCVATLHGAACPVRGRAWTLTVPLGPKPSPSAARPVDASLRRVVERALAADRRFELPAYYARGAGDTYFSGKMLAKQARLAAIARDLGDDATARALSEKILGTLRAWLDPQNAETRFVYDETWGGLVSCGCDFDETTESCRNGPEDECPGLGGCGANFGNGFFNDHHYHYGYFAYAGAVACDVATQLCSRDLRRRLEALTRDYATSTQRSTSHAFARHKDWYLGHSWASGVCLPPNPNGRNQESASEAVNAYEAAALLGTTLGDADLAAFGRLLLATEVDASKRYWHSATSNVLPAVYDRSVDQGRGTRVREV